MRPDLNPIAETLGPSFPSGHSATAAAFWAAAALVLGRGRPRLTRALLAGGAVGITVAVAGSRVLLDVHWLSDVIAGVALGWGWFAACSIAFGGRVLRFGAAAERAGEQAVAEAGAPRRGTKPPRVEAAGCSDGAVRQTARMATWLVTGANRGIGLELARQLHARGDTVIATCRSSSPELDAVGCRVLQGIDVGSDGVGEALDAALETGRDDRRRRQQRRASAAGTRSSGSTSITREGSTTSTPSARFA